MPLALAGLRLADLGQCVGAAGVLGGRLGLGFVGKNADLAGFGAEIGGVAAAHQQMAALVSGLLAAPPAGQLIGRRQMGVFIRGYQGGGHRRTAAAQRQAGHRHQQGQGRLQHRQQHRPEGSHRQRGGQSLGQAGKGQLPE